MSVKLLKTTTDGAASQKSNEIHLKLDNCQLNGISIDTSGLLATWPEFWAIGLSFLGLNSWFCVFHYLASSPTLPPHHHQKDNNTKGEHDKRQTRQHDNQTTGEQGNSRTRKKNNKTTGQQDNETTILQENNTTGRSDNRAQMCIKNQWALSGGVLPRKGNQSPGSCYTLSGWVFIFFCLCLCIFCFDVLIWGKHPVSRRLYSYVLWCESTLCKTPHFQWIYGRLSQIYEKLRSDQSPNGPKICARRTKTDCKDWAFTA